MTPTIKEKALALVKQFYPECRDDYQGRRLQIAIAAIEQHEATKQEFDDFKQRVSDAVEYYYEARIIAPGGIFSSFYIPKPKPDPVVVVCDELGWDYGHVGQIRAALDALGFEIREKNDD